ncbi:hypothetical protein GMSM_43500 [Geomonas sp. Red276]
MAEDVTRYISTDVERELWARAAGRCEFDGCNKLLYKSPVTQEKVNIAEKAHIYSFSEDGPRGWGPFKLNKKKLNEIGNLMLMCHDCHKLIDQDKDGIRYSADLLRQWKREHEHRIAIVTGIATNKKSHVIMYGANIGSERSPLNFVDAVEAMFPARYPVEEKPVDLSMSCEHEDKDAEYWTTEKNHLTKVFEKHVQQRIMENDPAHFSLFSLAPQPLLIQLGALFTDKIAVDVYQPIREPRTWKWQTYPDSFSFLVNEPSETTGVPVLLMSLSDRIAHERASSIVGPEASIWEITVPSDFLHNDFVRSSAQLSQFRQTIRKVMVAIKGKHGQSTPVHIFPAMPVSCAVEMGRARMPKADMPWVIYDQNHKANKFIQALEIS